MTQTWTQKWSEYIPFYLFNREKYQKVLKTCKNGYIRIKDIAEQTKMNKSTLKYVYLTPMWQSGFLTRRQESVRHYNSRGYRFLLYKTLKYYTTPPVPTGVAQWLADLEQYGIHDIPYYSHAIKYRYRNQAKSLGIIDDDFNILWYPTLKGTPTLK